MIQVCQPDPGDTDALSVPFLLRIVGIFFIGIRVTIFSVKKIEVFSTCHSRRIAYPACKSIGSIIRFEYETGLMILNKYTLVVPASAILQSTKELKCIVSAGIRVNPGVSVEDLFSDLFLQDKPHNISTEVRIKIALINKYLISNNLLQGSLELVGLSSPFLFHP
jgi:hypothetical protein